MRAQVRIAGRWRGIYRYHPSELVPKRDPVSFTLTLKQGWFGRFKGTVEDDSGRGMPGVGSVDGHFSYPRVRFIKQMPTAYIATPQGGRTTLREALEKFGLKLAGDAPHPPILYTGEFVDPTHARGTWVIPPRSIRVDEERVLKLPGATGEWDLEAV